MSDSWTIRAEAWLTESSMSKHIIRVVPNPTSFGHLLEIVWTRKDVPVIGLIRVEHLVKLGEKFGTTDVVLWLTDREVIIRVCPRVN